MNAFEHMMQILSLLDEKGIYYRLNKVSTENDCILIDMAVPGERWEIEIDEASNVYIEKFVSDGSIYGEDELDTLLSRYSSTIDQAIFEAKKEMEEGGSLIPLNTAKENLDRKYYGMNESAESGKRASNKPAQ